MTQRWDRKDRIKYVKNVEWCRENNLTINFQRGQIQIYDNDGDLLIEGQNLNNTIKRLQKRQRKSEKKDKD